MDQLKKVVESVSKVVHYHHHHCRIVCDHCTAQCPLATSESQAVDTRVLLDMMKAGASRLSHSARVQFPSFIVVDHQTEAHSSPTGQRDRTVTNGGWLVRVSLMWSGLSFAESPCW